MTPGSTDDCHRQRAAAAAAAAMGAEESGIVAAGTALEGRATIATLSPAVRWQPKPDDRPVVPPLFPTPRIYSDDDAKGSGTRRSGSFRLGASSPFGRFEGGGIEMSPPLATPPSVPYPRRGRKFFGSGNCVGGDVIDGGGIGGDTRREREAHSNDGQDEPVRRSPSRRFSPTAVADATLAAVAATQLQQRHRPSPASTPSSTCCSSDCYCCRCRTGSSLQPISSPFIASPPPFKAAKLLCPTPTPPSRSSSTSSCLSQAGCDDDFSPASPDPSSSYCGHYIVLVGWSEVDRVFIARDPALPPSPPSFTGTDTDGGGESDNGSCSNNYRNANAYLALTPEAFDRARRSYGTDEDVLVIDLERSRRGGVATAPLAAAAAATAFAASAASSAATVSAMVGLLAMAAAATAAAGSAASSAEGSSGFKEWAWPDPAGWFGSSSSKHDAVAASASGGGEEDQVLHARDTDENGVGGGGGGARGGGLLPREDAPGGAESAAKRLAGVLSVAASGWRFPTVEGAYRGPRELWRHGGGLGSSGEEGAEEEGERWAVRIGSAVEGLLLQGGRRAAYTMEGLFQGGAYTMEGLFHGGASTMEGLLQGGRRAAYTMEGLLEGGRRAAYSLRDSLADVAEAPGGAGADCYRSFGWNPPESPRPPLVVGTAAVMSPA